MVYFKTQGSTEIIAWRPWAVVLEQSEDAIKGLRIKNSIVPVSNNYGVTANVLDNII